MKLTEFIHKTVLQNEAVELLNCTPGKLYIDATAGGGGHSLQIAKRLAPEGKLVMFDEAIKASTERLKDYQDITTIVRSNYLRIPEVLEELSIDKIDGGVLFDLGTSFHQLTSGERGFSFTNEGELDMRMNPDEELTAYDVVNTWSQDDLQRIFTEYGEERFSGRIARTIVETRRKQKIKTTKELSDLVIKAVPNYRQKIHPATRVFQGIRIAVNRELEVLEDTLLKIIPLLAKNARIVVISFHSLEDRIVKNTFKHYSARCVCPKEKMICDCPPPVLKIVTKKPVVPSREEVRANSPSRSAKLRAAEKII